MLLTDEFIEDINKAHNELKKRLDSDDVATHENKEAIEQIQAEMDKLEETNQKFVKEYQAQKASLDALAASKDNYKTTDQFKAFEHFYKTGSKDKIFALPDEERKQLMRTDSNVDGGFLVPEAMDAEMRRAVSETSNIRSISRVKTMVNKTLQVVVKQADSIVASFEGEAEAPAGDSAPTYYQAVTTPFRQTVTIPLTHDMLMDAGFDMESELRTDVAIAFAQNEGVHHVSGDGVKKPAGFAVNPTIQAGARTGATSSVIGGDDVLNLMGDIKAGYEGVFVFNRATLRVIRTLKDGVGNYVFQPAFTGGSANSIVGAPFITAEAMADITANLFPIAFGDFRRGYEIFDRTGLVMIRDVYAKKSQAIIELTFHRWTTGNVIIPEAITLLKVKPA